MLKFKQGDDGKDTDEMYLDTNLIKVQKLYWLEVGQGLLVQKMWAFEIK